MAQQYINRRAVELDGILRFRSGGPLTSESDETMPVDAGNWQVQPAAVATFVSPTTATMASIPIQDLHLFKSEVADLGPEIIAIQAERGESGERHVTTFIEEESVALRIKIIDIQAKIIQKFPNNKYSFHIRVSPRDKDGNFCLPTWGEYYLLTWQAQQD